MNKIFPKIVKRVEDFLGIRFRKTELTDEVKFEAEIETDTGHLIVRKPFVKWVSKQFRISTYEALLFIVMHEGLHMVGINHDHYGHQVGYYSQITKDKFTPQIIKILRKR